MSVHFTARQILAATAVGSFAAVCFALYTQYTLGMKPCPWCILQRVICLAIALVAAAGALLPQRRAQLLASPLALALALSGMAAALWQHFVASASASCNLTLADRIVSALGLDTAIPMVFEAQASCADAIAALLGIPYAICTLILFTLLAVLSLLALWRHVRAADTGSRNRAFDSP